jgi:hypothetical protein
MLIMNVHEGGGVVPGRYAGEAIPIHDGPTPETIAEEERRVHADGLAGRICAAAADVAPANMCCWSCWVSSML